jgi:hypothetical protein
LSTRTSAADVRGVVEERVAGKYLRPGSDYECTESSGVAGDMKYFHLVATHAKTIAVGKRLNRRSLLVAVL